MYVFIYNKNNSSKKQIIKKIIILYLNTHFFQLFYSCMLINCNALIAYNFCCGAKQSADHTSEVPTKCQITMEGQCLPLTHRHTYTHTHIAQKYKN